MASPTPVDWTVLIFTTLAGTVVGTALSTYFARTSEIRTERPEVLRLVQHTETLSRQHDNPENRAAFEASLDEIDARCMLLGRRAYQRATIYRTVRTRNFSSRGHPSDPTLAPGAGVAESLAGFAVAGLLAGVIRHPWLSAISQRKRIRKIRAYMNMMGLSLPHEVEGELYGHLTGWMQRNEDQRAANSGRPEER